ncbi:TVP38/TMEM64 family protein [Paracoccus zeaxanthinifaciens]|uniref:TVP38/TMEM64 family protein n=1 Tax=Paracoccus zeaxanthinifaciens TaxID=187400 RepID=UPI0003B51C10|nr:VTT domain-containing protein [Paracoccus zeaxanthinifaciens]
MNPAIKGVLVLLALGVVIAGAPILWPSLSALQADLDQLRILLIRAEAWRDANPALSLLFFVLIVGIGASLPLPVIVPMALIGGAVFGFWLAMALVVAGTMIAALLTFALGRYWLNGPVRRLMGARADRLDARVAENGLLALLSLRLTPGLPFFVLNLLSGLSRMTMRGYAAVTALGVLPNSAILVAAGTQIAEIERVRDIVGPRIIAIVAMLAVFPWIARWAARTVRAR